MDSYVINQYSQRLIIESTMSVYGCSQYNFLYFKYFHSKTLENEPSSAGPIKPAETGGDYSEGKWRKRKTKQMKLGNFKYVQGVEKHPEY